MKLKDFIAKLYTETTSLEQEVLFEFDTDHPRNVMVSRDFIIEDYGTHIYITASDKTHYQGG